MKDTQKQIALEALNTIRDTATDRTTLHIVNQALASIAALQEVADVGQEQDKGPEQAEPIRWLRESDGTVFERESRCYFDLSKMTPLFTHPAPQPASAEQDRGAFIAYSDNAHRNGEFQSPEAVWNAALAYARGEAK